MTSGKARCFAWHGVAALTWIVTTLATGCAPLAHWHSGAAGGRGRAPRDATLATRKHQQALGLISKCVPVIKDGDKWVRNPLVTTDSYVADGDLVYGEYKSGETLIAV